MGMGKLGGACFLIFLLLGIRESQAQDPSVLWDCTVEGCQNGGACDSSGITECVCVAPFVGQDCGVDSTGGACATNLCGTFGDCYVVAGTDTCVCDRGYVLDAVTGTCLEMVRIVSCSSSEIVVRADVYPAFAAVPGIIALNQEISLDCFITAATDTTILYSATTCGGPIAAIAGGTVTDPTTYEITILLQLNPNIQGPSDYVATLTCAVPADGGASSFIVSGSGVTAIEDDLNAAAIPAKDAEVGVTVTLENAAGTPVVAAAVAEIITLKIALDSANGFDGFVVSDITAYEISPNPTVTGVVFVTDGCALKSAHPYITSFTYVQTLGFGAQAVMEIKTFKFINFDTLSFEVTVLTYADAATAIAALATCDTVATAISGASNILPDDVPAGRRKKRQAIDDGKESHLAVATRVYSNRPDVIYTTAPAQSSGNCMREMAFLLPLILMGVMLIVATLVAVYFCLKVSKRHRYHDGKENMAYHGKGEF